MKNVLVFPCGSEIGLEIYRSLNKSIHFNLIGASSVEDHGAYVYENYLSDVPHIDHPDFISRINEIVAAHNIDFIFPAHDSAVLRLAQAKADGSISCEVVTSTAETCEIARSKRKTYEVLRDVIPVPHIFGSPTELQDGDYPVFLKPDVGQGSKGTYKVNNLKEVEFYVGKDPSLLVLEYLPGKEYTIDCFTDKTGMLRFAEGRERARISNGISVSAKTVHDDRFYELAQKIQSALAFRGVWFFQVKERANGEFVLLEIAPRIAGTMGLVRCKGVNLALLSLFDALGYDVDVAENAYDLTIDRALQNSYKHNISYDHVYMDFDDLVISGDQVNPEVIAFVFQCRNRGIPVHLITRHKQDLNATLEKLRLQNVFDELIWIQDERPKYEAITEKNAIFIDDAFAERSAVHTELGIPVFDAHMIEALRTVK